MIGPANIFRSFLWLAMRFTSKPSAFARSLIRGARDGQQLYNYWRSAAAELIALAPKSKWLVTAKQIAQYKTQWDKSNLSPKPYLMYEPDERVSTAAPSRVAPPEPPAAMWHEAALVNDDLKAATGIYDASLGAKGNETSGVAIARRQQEGDVSNYHFSRQSTALTRARRPGDARFDSEDL